ncbi:hypothetical protein MTO96_049948, partial [Rhipicephalus appendiculatus]
FKKYVICIEYSDYDSSKLRVCIKTSPKFNWNDHCELPS